MRVKFEIDIDLCQEPAESVEEKLNELIDDLMYQLGKELAIVIDDYKTEFE